MPTDDTSKEDKLRLIERDALTFYTDGYIGIATSNGIMRILLGQTILDLAPSATMPVSQPVLNLMMTQQAAKQLAEYILKSLERCGSDGRVPLHMGPHPTAI